MSLGAALVTCNNANICTWYLVHGTWYLVLGTWYLVLYSACGATQGSPRVVGDLLCPYVWHAVFYAS